MWCLVGVLQGSIPIVLHIFAAQVVAALSSAGYGGANLLCGLSRHQSKRAPVYNEAFALMCSKYRQEVQSLGPHLVQALVQEPVAHSQQRWQQYSSQRVRQSRGKLAFVEAEAVRDSPANGNRCSAVGALAAIKLFKNCVCQDQEALLLRFKAYRGRHGHGACGRCLSALIRSRRQQQQQRRSSSEFVVRTPPKAARTGQRAQQA
jgi:hypothetical protein